MPPAEEPKQIVHVIGPPVKKPDMQKRFQFHFDMIDTPEDILRQLAQVKSTMGFNTTVATPDTIQGKVIPNTRRPNKSSGFLYDHPETVVVIGHEGPDNEFVEDVRLKGPAKPVSPAPAEPATPPAAPAAPAV